MKKVLIIIVLLFLSNVLACEEGQIDINSASLEELDNLVGIGPVKAEAIINSRNFESVDDLIKVYGIGEATLNKIKEQGLACVNIEEEIEDEEEVVEKKEIFEEKEFIKDEKPVENIEPKTITLATQNIKSDNDTQDLNKNNYAIYGLGIFCVLIVFLFVLKKFKVRKTEFE